MAVSKVIYKSSPSATGVTWIDLTQDTVSSASHIRNGYVGHLNDGTSATGDYSGTSPVLTTKNIAANGTYNASSDNADGYSSVTVAVSGSSMNAQVDNTNHRISGTTYTDTGASITVSTAGTYDIYWSAFRSSTSSGTNGTQWYKNDTAQGSAYTSWENSYCQTIKVTGVTLAKNDVVKVYARASSNSRYVCVSDLTIVQTS